MLQLSNITKRYGSGEFAVDALKGVTLDFRKSDFVSILGPSGCGKTTLLNIIGGLDKYTDGDLVINGKSTKNFNARDWDAYRNDSIGFVFQSYNLIPHQTVLQNVELSLALSGVKRAERVARAKQALDKVGLANMYHKRPGEMSGGQMQRVAIARAIVNNPDIILADEPTGALDTETSVQVMEILKEISRERLVVMVTHNPELAEKYSTRIVRMLDGVLVSDTAPLSQEEISAEQAVDAEAVAKEEELKKDKKHKKAKKPKMSFATSFMLSLKNLFTKRGRTVLTSFAGSIGIIGIALIFAVSQGTTNYINAVQEETLSSYPLTIEQTHTDMSSMFAMFSDSAKAGEPHDKDAVYEKLALYNLTNAITNITQSENDLASFKAYLDAKMTEKDSTLAKALNGVHYNYDLDMHVYTETGDGILRCDTTEIMQDMIATLYGVDVSQISFTGSGLMSMLMSSSTAVRSIWEEFLPAQDGSVINKLIKDQYNLVDGSWPTEGLVDKSTGNIIPIENQIVLVVDQNYEIDDMTLYALGLKSRAEIDAIIDAARNGTDMPEASQQKITFEEIYQQAYKVIFNFECYKQFGGLWVDVRDMGEGTLRTLYEDDNVGLQLKVVGIIAENPDTSAHMLSGNICYTNALTKYILNKAQTSDVAVAQKASPDVDIFTGRYFQENNLTTERKAEIFRQYVDTLTNEQKASVYLKIHSVPTEQQIANATQTLRDMDEETLRNTILNMMSMSASSANLTTYIQQMSFEQLQSWIPTIAPGKAQMDNYSVLMAQAAMEAGSSNPEDVNAVLASKLDADKSATDDVCAQYFELSIEFSDSSYKANLALVDCVNVDSPVSISLYAVSFQAKKVIEKEIAAYNNNVEEGHEIRYTDYVGLIMNSVTTIINAITYVLIGFVSISLIVSSIMIGVITLISVQERTKEIGILRAIGASKRNVSSMFNAETVIIGFMSGLFGVLVTYILSIFINIALHALTGIKTLNAVLPFWAALILIAISMLLTLIAGVIPSRSAAKKDPVVALRTE